MQIGSYLEGNWSNGKTAGLVLIDARNGEEIGHVSGDPLDLESALNWGRLTGGEALRKMTFHERGRMLKALALHLTLKKEEFYKVSYLTGATKVDSWIDIEGGFGNLFTYASKGRREMPDLPFHVEGEVEKLSKGGTFIGHHIWTPLEGIAIHINAFNFPVWGMLEKIAVNLLAGMPALVKPATATCYLTHKVFEEIIASNILPKGALQLVCGGARDILDYVGSQDVVTFTGSATTGQMLKSHARIVSESVRFNMEADSLNCCILGEDSTPGTEEFDLFIKEVSREMTVKAGQKCTAIRRIIVPEKLTEDVSNALSKRLAKVVIGDPEKEGVRMGPLASLEQQREVMDKVSKLSKTCDVIIGGSKEIERVGGSDEGAFFAPTLLLAKNAMAEGVHDLEAFGPVSTIIPYKTNEEAISLAKRGKGSLVGSIVTKDDELAGKLAIGMASHHGRVLILNRDCAKESTGHGSPLPTLVHGGPGRAGGGEEMGGVRGVAHFMQRSALQGSPTTLSSITQKYMEGAKKNESSIHPFRKHFEELKIGDSLTTHKRTITEADIVNFGNLSWDHFYAHTDDTSFENTFFERRVAHGYFIISAAAGLFVDPKKGPVLANYGLDELRFTKPVYVGATIGVHLTVKEKIVQEDREGEVPRGIVKWLVEVFDDTGEVVAIATILTLVAKDPSLT